MSQPTSCHKNVKNAYIALGGNVTSSHGAPQFTIIETLRRIPSDSVGIVKTSRFYATPAFPAGSGPDFVNALTFVETELEPQDLLNYLHDIERQLGRQRHERWSARTIDLDLVAYEDMVLPSVESYKKWRDLPLEAQKTMAPEALVLPHPRLQDRSFVLGPLCDVAPEWRHPVLDLTAEEMFAARPNEERAELRPLDMPV